MARTRFKCQFIIYLCLVLLDFGISLPILRGPLLETKEDAYQNEYQDEKSIQTSNTLKEIEVKTTPILPVNDTKTLAINNESLLRQNLRPGQEVRRYTISITRDGDNFNGRAVIDVRLTETTRDDPIRFDCMDLTIDSVLVGVLTDANAVETDFNLDDDVLEITPSQVASNYIVIIEYSGEFSTDGLGLYLGQVEDVNYIAMNLHPTNARRVFPCVDEPSLSTMTSFTFEDMDFDNVLFNSMLEADSGTTFRSIEGPSHLWGMVAHSFNTINIPINNVNLYARRGITNQDAQAVVAINNYFTALNEWTEKPYLEIILNQNGALHMIAVPDVNRDWYALSTICIWEPYILMETSGSVRQRKMVITSIAEAMARQWFGYVLFPGNWRHQWVVSGLATYAAYDIAKNFQTDPQGLDQTLIDMNTIFTTDVIQEGLLLDSFQHAPPLQPEDDIFETDEIRIHMNSVINYKAPALLRMLRLIIGDEENDLIQQAARVLIQSGALEPTSTQNFYDALNTVYSFGGSEMIDEVDGFMETWVNNNGYPFITVGLRQGGVLITQERFSFTQTQNINYEVPITFTTSVNPNFDDIHPTMMMDTTITLNFELGEEDWVLMNLQGQGYYRVNYDEELWQRIIEALQDPERREEIHPLNRATLVDDSLNLARAGKIDYATALEIVLTMEHETEYAVWRALVRNIEFIRKRLMAYVIDNELDDNIYTRVIQRIIGQVEDELGFTPDNTLTEPAMDSLTRGLVMEHACIANYAPCVAAAVDWFYDPNDNEVVNRNIPSEIRPAVYCTMIREGDETEIAALLDRMELEASKYERLVILQALACSEDENFIQTYLEETVADDSPYVMEERLKIFEAIASSSLDKARQALNFMTTRTNDIRNMYGGADKLEQAIFTLAENMVDGSLVTDFSIWVNSLDSISNLDDSVAVAGFARNMITENLRWNDNYLESTYEWIDLNHAPTIIVSTLLLSLSLFIALFNN